MLVSTILATESVHGDIFRLKSGGQVHGTVLKRSAQGEYIVRTESGAVFSLSRRQVDDIDAQDEIDLEYAARSRSLPDTVEAHRELATWCKANRLTRVAKHHLRRIIELDPMDEAARLSLGYQQHRGRWLTRDEMMAARGLTRYDGDHRTSQDILLRERTKKREQAEAEWLRQIRTWVGQLDKRRGAEAAKSLTSIEDPLAARALVQEIRQTKDPRVFDLLLGVLAELRHPLAVTTLVDLSLDDPDEEIRLQCLEYLKKYHSPVSIQPYVKSLNERKNNNVTINRAAEALAQLGNPRAISPLIDALVTTHKFVKSKSTPGNINPTFTSGAGGGGGGLSMGGDKSNVYLDDVQNLNVRQALVELSGGQDYEFDEALWRIWFVKEKTPAYVDTRRDF